MQAFAFRKDSSGLDELEVFILYPAQCSKLERNLLRSLTIVAGTAGVMSPRSGDNEWDLWFAIGYAVASSQVPAE